MLLLLIFHAFMLFIYLFDCFIAFFIQLTYVLNSKVTLFIAFFDVRLKINGK